MTAPTKLDGGGSLASGRSRPGDAGTPTQGAAVPAAVDHLPATRAWLARQVAMREGST